MGVMQTTGRHRQAKSVRAWRRSLERRSADQPPSWTCMRAVDWRWRQQAAKQPGEQTIDRFEEHHGGSLVISSVSAQMRYQCGLWLQGTKATYAVGKRSSPAESGANKPTIHAICTSSADSTG